jgi:signal transduction histidine kinase
MERRNLLPTWVLALASLTPLFVTGRAQNLCWLLYFGLVALQRPAPTERRWVPALLVALPIGLDFLVSLRSTRPHMAWLALGGAVVALWARYNTHALSRELDRIAADRAELAALEARQRVRDERLRIARDLHDGIGASLAALLWRVQRVQRRAGAFDHAAELDRLRDGAQAMLTQLRLTVWALHAPNRAWPELIDYLRTHLRELAPASLPRVTVVDASQSEPPASVAGDQALRVVRTVLASVRAAVSDKPDLLIELQHQGGLVRAEVDGALCVELPIDGDVVAG